LDKLLLREPKEKWDLYLEQGAGHREFFYKRKNNSKFYKKIKKIMLERRQKEYYLKLLNREGDRNNMDNQLELIFNHFAAKGCFLKKKCPIRNTRFHFIDIRQDNFGYDCKFSVSRWGDIFEILPKYGKKLHNLYQEDNLDNDDSVKILTDLREELDNFFNKFITGLKDIFKCFKSTDKIAKQIDNSELRNNILKYYGPLIKITVAALKYIYNIIKEDKEFFINFFIKATVKYTKKRFNWDKVYTNVIVKNIYDKNYMKLLKAINKYQPRGDKLIYLEEIYFNAQMLLMDLYFLGRMSRKFYNKSQNNVIVIAGRNHVRNYIKFLKSSWWSGGPGFKIKWKSKQESEKCSVIPNIFKP
jgi:hypothetical protein